MGDNPRSSFIPKQAPKAAPKKAKKKKRHFNIFSFLGSIILIASLASAGGVFVYKGQKERALVETQNALDAERQRFNEDDIALVREMDRLIKAAEYRLDQHTSVSKIFEDLELLTNQNVQFESVQLSSQSDGTILVALEGKTRTFTTVALQERKFVRDNAFAEAIFQEVNNSIVVPDPEADEEEQQLVVVDPEEDFISFSVEVQVPFDSVKYSGRVSGASEVAVEPSAFDQSEEDEPEITEDNESDV